MTTNTQMYFSRKGEITKQIREAAEKEDINPDTLRRLIAEGKAVLPANINHKNLKPAAIGKDLKCKVNVNLGTSQLCRGFDEELKKLEVALKFGADTIMDLSVAGDLNKIREEIIKCCPVALGTVPVYQMAQNGNFSKMSVDEMFDIVETQAKQGVDFMTIHASILKEHLPLVQKRVMKIVSRGGSLIADWMIRNNKENPFYTHFDRLLKICKKYDVTISLGDALRPGSILDASDQAQLAELKTSAQLTLRAWREHVQVMVEGPGHLPLNHVMMNMQIQQQLCHGAPFYVLGPIVCDVAAGYDHIASAIGSALAGFFGVALLCYLTPREHLGLPDVEDVKQGLIAHKIAAHVVDLAKGKKDAVLKTREMAKARFEFDWDKQFALSFEPEFAKKLYYEMLPENISKKAEFCSMCGPNFCPIKISKTFSKDEKSAL
jgi:phosphomethylpyrimidine synthase